MKAQLIISVLSLAISGLLAAGHSAYSEDTPKPTPPISAEAPVPTPTAETIPTPTPPATEKPRQVIQDIQIVGLKRLNPEAVTAKMQLHQGDVFSAEVFEGDIRRLSESGFFTKVNWSTETVPDGIKIIITVEETQNIQEINFEGLKAISQALIEKDMKLKVDGPLNSADLKNDQNLIIQKYKESGYAFVEVSSRVDNGTKGQIANFIVREGPSVQVKEIIFNGNTSFPYRRVWWGLWLLFSSDPLMDTITTHLYHWYSSGYYQENELYLDIERIKTFYRSEGWLDVKVFVEDLKFTEFRDWVSVFIRVEEGLQYNIGSITLSGNTIITTSEIMDKVQDKSQQPYKLKMVATDINMIKTLYGKFGYIDCNVDIRTHFPVQPAGTVDITYDISEGKPSYLERVIISGNVKTRDKVIRREVTISPGDMMDYGAIKTSMDRIGSSRYFQKLEPDIEPGSKDNTKNLHIKVEEAPTGELKIGGGYSSNSGFGGVLEYSQNNFDISKLPSNFSDFFTSHSFAGAGQYMRIYWQPGITSSQKGIQFTEPYLFNKPVELSVRYSTFERNWLDYNEDRNGGSFSLAYRFPDQWKVGAGPRLENVKITDVEPTAPAIIREMVGTSNLRSINIFCEHDKRDSWLIPSEGYHWKLSYELAGGALGGDFNFTRRTLKTEIYTTPIELSEHKRIILSFDVRAAQIQEFGDSSNVPAFERLYAGGFNSVRGFDFRTISPKEDGIPIGGKVVSTVNTELTYPLYTETSLERPLDILRFLVFYDVGNAAERWSDLTWNTFRTSIGFGFRVQLGMMPISLTMSYPIKSEPDDDFQRIQLDLLNFGF